MSTKKKVVRGKGTPKSTPRPPSKPKPPPEKKEESVDEGKKNAVDVEVYDDKDESEKKKIPGLEMSREYSDNNNNNII